jgi:ADP-ribose pyrophosphatase
MDSEPDRSDEVEVIGTGLFLRLVRKSGWEYVERTRPVGSAFIGAITVDGRLIVTEEYRVPMGRWVIGCPAGLVGDLEGSESEQLADAVGRELVEEVGYQPGMVRLLTAGPTSPGQNAEVIAIVLADGLRRVGPGGGTAREQIRFHEVPLAEIDGWLSDREREGRLIDPKVYSVLYFIRCRSALGSIA